MFRINMHYLRSFLLSLNYFHLFRITSYILVIINDCKLHGKILHYFTTSKGLVSGVLRTVGTQADPFFVAKASLGRVIKGRT